MNQLWNRFYLLLGQLDYLVILAMLFLAVSLTVGGGIFLLLNRSILGKRVSRFLSKKPAEAPGSEDRPRLMEAKPNRLLAHFARPLEKLSAPDDGAVRNPIRIRLCRAGLPSRSALQKFLAAKVLCCFICPLAYLVLAPSYSLGSRGILYLITAVVAGFFLPDLAILQLAQKRQEKLRRGLPDALDLMVVSVEAGLGLDMTFKRVGEEIRPVCRPLGDEFLLTNLEIRAGKPRPDSFHNMSLRTGVTEISQLMTTLTQTSRFGTSVANALRVHAEAMRVKRRQLAEEQAAKTAIKLLFPLVMFIFPTIFVVLLGPAVIRIIKVLFPILQRG